MKYKIFERGGFFSGISDSVPKDFPIVGSNDLPPVTTRLHYMAAGWSELMKNMTEQELNSAAHFCPPYAQEIE